MSNFEKSTEFFTKTIQNYLEERAKQDSLFAAKFNNPDKSIKDCVNFIYNSVIKSGCCGFTDDEVFGLAVHYYDEDLTNVELDKQFEHINLDESRVICNREITLSDEELKEIQEAAKAEAEEKAKKDAFDKAYKEAERKYTAKPQKPTAAPKQEEQPQLDLFGDF